MLYGVFDKLKLEVRAATRAALPTLLNQQRRADERKRLGTLIPGRTAFVFSLPASWSFWAAVVSRGVTPALCSHNFTDYHSSLTPQSQR